MVDSMSESTPTPEGKYAHVFVYRIPKSKHDSLLQVEEKLSRIFKKHGMLGSRICQLGKTSVFQGFQGFDKALGTSPDEEVWIETDFYSSEEAFRRIVPLIEEDKAAEPLFGELMEITKGHQTIMGEFVQLTGA
jgi:uncharacterized protein YbaA (DUF1428 family)